MSTYTRGPWHYDDDTATIENELGVSVAGVNVDLDEYEANASLLAAAPDLLAALVTLIHNGPMPQTGTEKRAYQTAALAVAKAEGRSQ